MKRFELDNNDWLLFNNIIYKIYTTDEFNDMRMNIIEDLKMLMDFDAADFFLVNDRNVLCDGIGIDSDLEKSINYSSDIMSSGKCMVYRETDINDDSQRTKSKFYRALYMPNRWHYSIHMMLAYNKKVLGIINFYRTIGKDNFNYDDIFILDMLKEHIAYRLYTEKVKNEGISSKISIRTAVEKFKLTKREETILRELLDGKDNGEICGKLVISSNTLKKHILNIYRKLGINNRVQMFKMIREHE